MKLVRKSVCTFVPSTLSTLSFIFKIGKYPPYIQQGFLILHVEVQSVVYFKFYIKRNKNLIRRCLLTSITTAVN